MILDESWVDLDESVYQQGMNDFRKYVRLAIRGRVEDSHQRVRQEGSDPKYKEMLDLAQTVLPRKPTQSEVEAGIFVIADELGASKEEVQGLVNENLTESAIALQMKIIWVALKASWAAFAKGLSPTLISPGFINPSMAVVIAIGLGIAAYLAGRSLEQTFFGWIPDLFRWAKKKWKIKTYQENEVEFPSDFPRSAYRFLIKGETYRFRVKVPIFASLDPTDKATLQPLVPFEFIGFGAPTWISEVFIMIKPSVSSEEAMVPIGYLSSIEDLEGQFIKEMK